jgi:hypothetical protein
MLTPTSLSSGRPSLKATAAPAPLRILRIAAASGTRVDFVASRSSRGTIREEEAMKYMLLIHQGSTPTPRDPEAWGRLSQDEQNAVYGAYRAINETPGVTPGVQMGSPETATTVRVRDGKTLTTDGPFAEVKEAIGGYFFFEAGDLDAAIELAARVPAASMGGAIEVRPIEEGW